MFFAKLPTRFRDSLKGLLSSNLVYCDVGARDGLALPWKVFEEFLAVVSFEPDQEEYQRLKASQRDGDICLPLALGGKQAKQPFYLTQNRGCSSLYLPNENWLKQFPDSERFSIERTIELTTSTLDGVIRAGQSPALDFIKLDTQGSEFEILQGGRETLAEHILGIELEVEFAPLYRGQPLFSEVDPYIRQTFGMQLMDLRHTYWKYKGGEGLGSPKGQLVFGDALYFRDISQVDRLLNAGSPLEARKKLEKMLLIALAYGYFDYAWLLTETGSAKKYLNESQIQGWKRLLRLSGASLKVSGVVSHRTARVGHAVSDLLYAIYRLFQRTHNGWAVSSGHLGSRKRWGWFQ